MSTAAPPAASDSDETRDLTPRGLRQSGVDRFDEAIVVSRTRAWLGLGALLVLLAGVLVWSVAAKDQQTVRGTGAALANGAIKPAITPADGVVRSIAVSIGQKVTVGTPLATVGTARGVVTVAAQVDEQVLQVTQQVGSLVDAGNPVMYLAKTTGAVDVYLYVSPATALRLRVGTKAQLRVGGVSSPIGGTVTAIGALPSTLAQAASSVGSPTLARLIGAADGSVPIVVHPANNWPRQFVGFDYAQVTLIVGEKRPIDYVF